MKITELACPSFRLTAHTSSTVLVGCLLFACGGSSDSGNTNTTTNPPVDTGLPPEKELGELTPAESEQLCEAVQMTLTGVAELIVSGDTLCTLFAAAVVGEFEPDDADAIELCEGFRDRCIEDPPEEVTAFQEDFSVDTEVDSCDTSELQQCQVTVAEFEACLTAFNAQLNEILEPLTTCAGASQVISGMSPVDGLGGAEVGQDIPECAKLEACDSSGALASIQMPFY